ncbi:efflux RND transporter permease subunit [Agaribacterium haliotis]|uniref:efflux RND transporter permease subunit n=1 Tax=Agaribacterium haliotis TaxID=2013869 RepID=UPI000BB58339|nr:efflux RND transporter permease subunit [Agaribacterium haliotis]
MGILNTAISRSRATLCMMLLILAAGVASRMNMVIEASPNPSVPVVMVMLMQDGVSPEDGARLLVRPMEKELRTIEGVKEIRSTSRETLSYVVVEFEADQDVDQALIDVRAAVDRGKSELPSSAEEPRVMEIAADGAPTIVLALSGQVSERTLFHSAQLLKREIEAMPSVLEVEMIGHREEVIEVIVEPARLEYYGITSRDLFAAIQANNLLVPAGQLDTGKGRFAVKVPSLIETAEDVYSLPIRSDAKASVTLGDIASVRRTFKDASSFSSINGERGITLNVKKRGDANDIEVTTAVRTLAAELKPQLPAAVKVDFMMDQSDFSIGMINEMQGNILTAMALVMVIVIAALGFRSGLLVGAGVPFSLLFSSIILLQLGYSFNFMVLFGMLLALGMLIDGAIVITEFADRKMAEGLSSKDAYILSVRRMIWPVTASTSTTLAAFLPIMFWPGVAGEFMRYLPVTVFAVLLGSLLYALFFAPILGSLMGRNTMSAETQDYLTRIESDEPENLPGLTGRYARFLSAVIHHPLSFFFAACLTLVAIFSAYGKLSAGVEFFVKTEVVLGQVEVRAQGNLSIEEARALALEVEQRVLEVPGVKVLYSIVSPGNPVQLGPRAPEQDQIASMLVETYKPEQLGYSTFKVYEEIQKATQGLPGIHVSSAPMEGGPPIGKPIQLQLVGLDREQLLQTTRDLRGKLEQEISGLKDVTDSTPLPGIEWSIEVDKQKAAQVGADVSEVGNFIQLITTGVKIGEYRPADADDEVDIRVRFPANERGITAMDRLKVNTVNGATSIAGFVERVAMPKVDSVKRVDGKEYAMVLADVEKGLVADTVLKEVQQWIEQHPLPAGIELSYRGANEEQEKSFRFLATAFSLALFLMFILLVAQFNSFYQACLTLSSVILSTAGVLLGLMLTQSTFSVIMTGVGIVALAGIVVNNNIVLIDTFNYIRQSDERVSVKEAAILAATQRLRPVFLTTCTTILGLLPLATGLSIDLVNRDINFGGVVGSYWVSLASAIVYGLVFATVLTLAVTPTMLVLPSELKLMFKRYVKQPLVVDFRSLHQRFRAAALRVKEQNK